ncbi:unnamed protein product [Caenorhabditis bovis]|uniref:Uncharacterized protein n=1 Tax=Caenorhabditis bovis TaxID=2654633 RepID=A0A8S1EE33_9PELO|nr:unnamed protein product [Caenorhabditis bovis]
MPSVENEKLVGTPTTPSDSAGSLGNEVNPEVLELAPEDKTDFEEKSDKVASKEDDIEQSDRKKKKKKKAPVKDENNAVGQVVADDLSWDEKKKKKKKEERVDKNNAVGQIFEGSIDEEERGRPFWCNKDEKPPASNNYVMTLALRDLAEGKWTLLSKTKDPKDLDPFNTMEAMQGRDAEFFKKDKRILSNTVRSLVTMYDIKARAKRGSLNSENSFKELAVSNSVSRPKISFILPTNATQYNKLLRCEKL